MIYLLYTIHVLICIFLILVVLLQQGSGADLSVFGGGSTQTAFGARGASSLLHRLTVGAFVGFILTTVTIGFVKMGAVSVMTEVEAAGEPAAPAPAAAAGETAGGEAGDGATAPAAGDATEPAGAESPSTATPPPDADPVAGDESN